MGVFSHWEVWHLKQHLWSQHRCFILPMARTAWMNTRKISKVMLTFLANCIYSKHNTMYVSLKINRKEVGSLHLPCTFYIMSSLHHNLVRAIVPSKPSGCASQGWAPCWVQKFGILAKEGNHPASSSVLQGEEAATAAIIFWFTPSKSNRDMQWSPGQEEQDTLTLPL